MLMYSLADSAQRDIFYKLCRDIVASSASRRGREGRGGHCRAAHMAMASPASRRFGQRLTAEQQKGLIGELLVLERFLLHTVDVADALSAWHGPLRRAQGLRARLRVH